MMIPKAHHLLLAEDNKAEQILFEVAMEDSGLAEVMNLSIAFNGEEAIEALDIKYATYFDLILLDLNMPKVSGKEVLKYLKVLNPVIKPLVIVFSNSDNITEIQECYRLGAQGYIQKPIDYEQLVHLCSVIQHSIKKAGFISMQYIEGHYPVVKP